MWIALSPSHLFVTWQERRLFWAPGQHSLGLPEGMGPTSSYSATPGGGRRAPSCQGSTSEEPSCQGERKAQEQQQYVWDSRIDLILPVHRKGSGAFARAFRYRSPGDKACLVGVSTKLSAHHDFRGFNSTTIPCRGKGCECRCGRQAVTAGNRAWAAIRCHVFSGTFPLSRGSLRSPAFAVWV